MAPSFTDAFQDDGGVICNSFFTSADVSEKNWGSLERLAATDDTTFWTVICRHEKIAALIWNCAHAIDLAHSTASTSARRAVKKEYELSLMVIVIRIATTTDVCLKRFVRGSDLARRVGEVLPLKVLLPASVTLLRRSGATASIVLTSLCIINPAYLSRFAVQLSEFYDQVERIASRCTSEMKRGRFQRLAGDMLPLIEQCFRITKHVWAFVQSVPFIADYVPLPKLLRTLRIVVDVVSPCLQHFIIVSDVLKNRRDVLSRANSVMINAALNTASVLILYRTFDTPRARASCCPQVCKATYDQLASFLMQYTKGVPFIVISNWKLTIQDLMHQLCRPDESEDGGRVGIVLRQLVEPIENSRDFSDLFAELRPRFFELLLIDLVRQRFHIDTLLAQQFLTSDEAKRLGASEDAITRALAGLDVEEPEEVSAPPSTSASPSPAAEGKAASSSPSPQQARAPPPEVDDPLVSMVLDIFPFYNPVGVRAAMNFYKNDAEQFILDASMENVPPHLIAQLNAASAEEAEHAAETPIDVAAAAELGQAAAPLPPAKKRTGNANPNKNHLQTSDYDTTITDDLLQFYLGKDLYDAMTGSEDDLDFGDEDEMQYRTYPQDGDHSQYADAGLAAAFQVDDDMKERIRLLNEIMYEDEFDDGQLEDVKAAGDDDGDLKEKEQPAVVQRAVGPAAAAAEGGADAAGAEGQQQPGIKRPPRSDYDDKRFHEKRAKERNAHIKEMKGGGGNAGGAGSNNNNNNSGNQQKKGNGGKGSGGARGAHDDGKTHKHVNPNAADGDNVPAYAKKKKVTKEKAGGKKGQLTRALKKGQLNSF